MHGLGIKEDWNGARQEDGGRSREEDDDVEEDTNSGHRLVDLRRRVLLDIERCFGGRHREEKIFLSVKGRRASSYFIGEDFHSRLNMTTDSEMVPSLSTH